MNEIQINYRKTAAIVGFLFIIGTVAGISSGVATGPVLGASDYLAAVAANESSIIFHAAVRIEREDVRAESLWVARKCRLCIRESFSERDKNNLVVKI